MYPTILTIEASPTTGELPFEVLCSGNLTTDTGYAVFGGEIHLFRNGVDVGFEYTFTAGQYSIHNYIDQKAPHIRGDFNGDGVIDQEDVDLLTSKFSAPYDPIYDLNDDGVIDLDDYAILNARWGWWVDAWNFQAGFSGTSDYAAAWSVVVPVWTGLMPTTLDITASPTSGRIPLHVSVFGQLKDLFGAGVNGKTINLFVNNVFYQSTVTGQVLDIGGYYLFTIDLNETGVYNFQALFEGDSTHAKSNSPIVQVIAGPMLTYALTVQSSPTGVSFGVDGITYVTPQTLTLAPGAHVITMPLIVVINSVNYLFEKWDNGSSDPIRVVDLSSDITVSAKYSARFSILLDSYPQGKIITVTGPAGTFTIITPSTVTLQQFNGTSYLIEADSNRFEKWEDGSTNPTRTYVPTADATLLATYTPIITYQLIINSSPQGKSAQIDSSTGVTPWTLKVSPGTYTIQMDPTAFLKWENEDTNPIRALTIGADVTVTAYYSGVLPSGCFIATAAYGTALIPQLFILRRFRDTCLPTSLTNLYYRLSPPIAKLVKQHKNTLGAVVRKLIEAFIKIFYS